MEDEQAWARHWAGCPGADSTALCRQCEASAAARRVGRLLLRARMRDVAVRDTAEGVYCEDCFFALPPCPVCGVAPTSHAEYPCAACAVALDVSCLVASGCRVASSVYRGWSQRRKHDAPSSRHHRRQGGY
jgi:hypothetical protein